MRDQKTYSFEEYMTWVSCLSNELGVFISSVTPGAKRLFHAAYGTKVEKDVLKITRGILILVSVNKLGHEETFGIFNVLAQCMAMGGVNSVNLKLQLCKYAPDVFDLFARAESVTKNQLNEALEKRSLDISVIPKFSEEVEKKYGEIAIELSKSVGASFRRALNTLGQILS